MMKEAKKPNGTKWHKSVLIPFWVVECLFMTILIGALAYLTSQFVIASEIIMILICAICMILTIVEIILFAKRNLRPRLYLVFQVIKTAIWLVIFLIVIIDTTTISNPTEHSTVVSTTNSNGIVAGSEVNEASPSGIAVLLNGVVEASVVLVTFVGGLIYASVVYHRHRKVRRQRGKHYAIPEQSDELHAYPVATPPRRPSFYGFRTRPTSRDSGTFRSSPFAERGLLGFQYPRNAWQQSAACNAGGANPASPTSTTALTHSPSVLTTTTAPPPRYESVAMDGRNVIFPSIHEVAGEDLAQEVSGDDHLHEVSGDDALHEVAGEEPSHEVSGDDHHLQQERSPRSPRSRPQELGQGQRQGPERARSRGPRTPLLPPTSEAPDEFPTPAEPNQTRTDQEAYELSARKSIKSVHHNNSTNTPAPTSPAAVDSSSRTAPSSRRSSRMGGTRTPTRLKGNGISRATSRASSPGGGGGGGGSNRNSVFGSGRRWWR